eukprot:gene16606-19725_t
MDSDLDSLMDRLQRVTQQIDRIRSSLLDTDMLPLMVVSDLANTLIDRLPHLDETTKQSVVQDLTEMLALVVQNHDRTRETEQVDPLHRGLSQEEL